MDSIKLANFSGRYTHRFSHPRVKKDDSRLIPSVYEQTFHKKHVRLGALACDEESGRQTYDYHYVPIGDILTMQLMDTQDLADKWANGEITQVYSLD